MPFDVPSGRAAMQPTITLRYFSGTANGALGVGWSLSTGASVISRCGRSLAMDGLVDGVDYSSYVDDAEPSRDRFCLDGRKLVSIDGSYGANGTEYRTIQESYAQIVSNGTSGDGPDTFIVKTKNGLIRKYTPWTAKRWRGTDSSLELVGTVRNLWLLESETDRSGNRITFWYYAFDDGAGGLQYLPKRIDYTDHPANPAHGARYVQFHYEDRPDKESAWYSGVRATLNKRLKSVTFSAPNPIKTARVWAYHFEYAVSSNSHRSLLTSVQKCGVNKAGVPGGCLWKKKFKWYDDAPLQFVTKDIITNVNQWGAPLGQAIGNEIVEGSDQAIGHAMVRLLDADGDGTDDVLFHPGWAGSPNPMLITSRSIAQQPFDGPFKLLGYQWFVGNNSGSFPMTEPLTRIGQGDSDGNGRQEVIVRNYLGSNKCETKFLEWVEGNSFEEKLALPFECTLTDFRAGTVGHILLDFNGDRLQDLLTSKPFVASGYHGYRWAARLNTGSGFGPTVESPIEAGTLPLFGWPLLTFAIDYDGDGRAEFFGFAEDEPNNIPSRPALFGLKDDDTFAELETSVPPEPYLGNLPLSPPDSPEDVYPGDYNGDGLRDVLWFKYEKRPVKEGSVRVADHYVSTGWISVCTASIRWNTGNGYTSPKSGGLSFPCVGSLRDHSGRVADINNDGRDDIVTFHSDLLGHTKVVFNVSTLAGFESKVLIGHNPAWVDGVEKTTGDTFPTSRLGDVNGDGFIDIVGGDSGSVGGPPGLAAIVQAPHYYDRLESITDEKTLWPRETVRYSSQWSDKPETNEPCSYPLICIRRGFPVVREVTTRAHLVDPTNVNAAGRTIYYSYEDPVAHARGRGFLGFRKVRRWDPSRPSETVTIYSNRVWQGSHYPFDLRPVSITNTVPLAVTNTPKNSGIDTMNARVTRRIFFYQIRELNGGQTWEDQPTNWKSTEWEQSVNIDLGTIDPKPGNITSEHIFGLHEPSVPLRLRYGYSKFDDFGNMKERKETTAGGVSRQETSLYDNLTAEWLIGLKRSYTITVQEFNNQDHPAQTRTFEYGYDALGRLDNLYEERDSADPNVRRTTTLTYDTYGLITRAITKAGSAAAADTTREVRIEYGPVWPNQPDEHIHPSQIWSPYSKLKFRPSHWLAFHPAFGVVTNSMDVNGLETLASYDDLGRLVSTRHAGQALQTVHYMGRDDTFGGKNGIVVAAKRGSSTAVKVTTDALNRTIKTTSKTFDGTLADVTVTYDLLGRVKSRSRPFTNGVPGLNTKFSYDSLDRLISVEHPDNTTITHQHDFFTSHSFDNLTHKKTLKRDLDNRVVESVSWLKTKAIPDGVSPVVTRFRYAPFDQMDLVTDADGNVVRTSYDVRGRPILQETPDSGTVQVQYNGFGEVISRTHVESGDVSEWRYDSLGRLQEVKGLDGVTESVWDKAANGIGKVYEITSPDNIKTRHTYDSEGRLKVFEQTIHGKAYVFKASYDEKDRLSKLSYPAIDGSNVPALTLEYKYNAADYLGEIGYVAPGTTYRPLITVKSRDFHGSLLNAKLGNGVNIVHTYEPVTARLKAIQIKKGVNNKLFEQTYAYWSNGLVKTREDNVVGRHELFDYDEMNRLKIWDATYQGSTRFMRYGYDSIGNLTDVYLNQELIEHNNYGDSDGALPLPHALTQRIVGPISEDFSYDLRGRQIKGGLREITKYSDFDLPRSISMKGKSSSLLYDGRGKRAKKTTPVGETIYVGGLYEMHQRAGKQQHVFHVMGPDGALADITQANGASPKMINYLANDLLGSVGAVIDNQGVVAQRLFFEPYGRRIGPDGSSYAGGTGPIQSGFTGHEHDTEYGLINMRGRVFDPALKRYLTPDPAIAAPLFGQAWNTYSYVNNSPLNANDPSGFRCERVTFYEPGKAPVTILGPGCDPFSPDVWASMVREGVVAGYVPGWGGADTGGGNAQTPELGFWDELIRSTLLVFIGFLQPSLVVQDAYDEANSRPDAGAEPTELPPGGLDYSAGAEGGMLADPAMLELAKFTADALVPGPLDLAVAIAGRPRANQRATEVFNSPTTVNGKTVLMPVVIENTGHAYSYSCQTDGNLVENLATRIAKENPHSVIYVGTGGHGDITGRYFGNDASLIEPAFLKEDMAALNMTTVPDGIKIPDGGVIRVLNLTQPVDKAAFRRAEAAAEQGAEGVFTIRAWCYGSCTPF
jgi:RHS repeat-associated protein